MIRRVRAAWVAIITAAAVATLAAPAAQAADVGKPKTDCVWIWTVEGPACHWQ
ncbi:hypothetical protein [Amycolatopsis australiensis]|uniref:Uncharacterized protein n=1 Tax=Amycolatopsis australiensis TaxID=546364 RepID=A0A1K1RDA5_9PSEU|nr:hypothetical protein [Amycolatopsis australiensis]SFW69921.1 hypothetical protein SAMN04489730_3042 [Amycolatopsis australiensis]